MSENTARTASFLVAAAITLAACTPAPPSETAAEATSWSVTAWGDLYEIFPEVDALVAGHTATAHTHVTVLDGFAPLTEGTVEILLRGAADGLAFQATAPARPGIFAVELRPEAPGDYDLLFRVASVHGEEEIPGGRVRVGTPEAPGALTATPALPEAAGVGESLPFLKEEQWRTEFATAWVKPGRVARTVEGLARVRPPAGGEAALTAPVDAVLQPEPWPFPGQQVRQGTPLFRLVPRNPSTGTVAALLEVAGGDDELVLGTVVVAQVLLDESVDGVVVPATARSPTAACRSSTCKSRARASRANRSAWSSAKATWSWSKGWRRASAWSPTAARRSAALR